MTSAARNSVRISLFTILSRILGVARDHYQAIFFGTGPIAFAWEIALLIPGMLRNLVAEGGLSQAFIPIYSQAKQKSESEASKTAGVILVFSFLTLLLFVLAGLFIMPYFLPVLAYKNFPEEQLFIYLGQVLLLLLLVTSPTAILAGISQAHYSFTLPALAPLFFNIMMLAGYFILTFFHLAPALNARYLAWILVGSGLLQLGIHFLHIWRLGLVPLPSFDYRHPALKRMFTLMAPAAFGLAVFQINHILDVLIVSYFVAPEKEAIPALRFANRLVNLPTGVIGVAISVSILPALANQLNFNNRVNREESEEERRENSRLKKGRQMEITTALNFALFLILPAMIGFLFLGEDIINLLFYGGEWDLYSTETTWFALLFMAFGIPSFSINRILTSAFYAHQDTKTPVRAAIITTFLNLGLNLILVRFLFHGGIALSTSITSSLYSLMLLFYMHRKHLPLSGRVIGKFLKRAVPLWLILALFLAISGHFTETGGKKLALSLCDGTPSCPYFLRYYSLFRVAIGAGGGFMVYMIFALLFKMEELKVFAYFRKGK